MARSLLVFFIISGLPQLAWALSEMPAQDFSQLSQLYVGEMTKSVAIGSGMHAYHPATPLGTVIGLDVGVDVTAVKVSQDLKDGLALATGQSPESIPPLIPFPRFVLHKGLPMGFDLGVHYAKVKTDSRELFRTYGAEVNWAFLRQPGKTAASLRVSGTYSKVYFISSYCYDFDAILSYPVLDKFVEPYFGAGLQLWSGTLEIPLGVPELPLTVSGTESGISPHFYAGLMIKLFMIKWVSQFEYSTAKITSYGLKLALSF